MPIPTGQNIPFNALRNEIRTGTANPTAIPGPIPLNNAQIRAYCFNPGPIASGTGARSISQARGVSFVRLVVAVDTQSYLMYNSVIAAGWPGVHRATTNCIINAGVTLYTPGVSNEGFDTGVSSVWPASSSAALTISPTAIINGKGGPGGAGGSAGGPAIPTAQWTAGETGTTGGTAMRVALPITIINNGTIAGGGGGGGGGNGRRVGPAGYACGGGGGGGGRSHPYSVSARGTGGPATGATTNVPGSDGGTGPGTTFGTGGQNTPQPAPVRAGVGGPGGGWGAVGTAGSSGGTPGTQGPGAGAAGGAGISIQNFLTYATYSGAGQRLGPTAS